MNRITNKRKASEFQLETGGAGAAAVAIAAPVADMVLPPALREKHEAARAFALSGSLSKYQRKKAEQKKSEFHMQVLKPASIEQMKAPIGFIVCPQRLTKAARTVAKRKERKAAAEAEHNAGMAPVIDGSDQQEEYISEDPSDWPVVKKGHWSYIYVIDGPHQGRFGYYDDHESSALVYFGAPLIGDGPYAISLSKLRKPPTKFCKNQAYFPM
uniref:Uncharacterized protein n=1 Tax=Entomoneis paludosa TaxID=265537 RepID=A0A7S2YD01_9STRA|mmetsp:Transcript_27619/g.57799  ORF Transcript_27619/g.57799 Transcript_27619/m.57799 type:complete len:213 (+) Transcript_27619:65-703(+)|eukprot:CAMPEP_0172460728 /NCGR_PEP_ID=MMETSP1065-20121228/38024_1 /TAXON_ID=265537 /ORGANISM="Amphiprora paludosa, Strain CCMP125" /LENGTH=212 /DNA_ID=CAMNT_0013215847 /DNA_START=18 /DNA_END=656 /DNA_ORIENTATION=+